MDVVALDRAVLNAGIERAASAVEERLASGPRLRLGAGHALKQHAEIVLAGLHARALRSNRMLDGGDPRETRVALTGLRRTLYLLRVLQHAVHPLQPSAYQLGLGSLYFIAEIARDLVGAQVDLIEAPSDAPRFATMSWPYSGMLNPDPTEQDVVPVLIHYPDREADATLLVPLLVHELGHPAAKSRDLVPRVQQRLEVDRGWPEVLELMREVAGSREEPAGPKHVRLELAAPIEELVCDALATACLGPSYLLAFAAWAGLDSAAEWQEQHPPTALRLGLIADQLRADGWDLTWMRRILAWAEGLRDVFRHEDANEGPRSVAMTLAAPHVRAVIDAELGDAFPRLRPARYEEQLVQGLEALYEQDILPAQLDHEGTAADRRCILLAGWKMAVAEHGDDPQALVDAFRGETAQKSNSFVDKALEMSMLLETWGRAKA